MNDAEYAAAIQDACKLGATISAIKCFVESIRANEREACAKVCENHEGIKLGSRRLPPDGSACARAIRMRSNN